MSGATPVVEPEQVSLLARLADLSQKLAVSVDLEDTLLQVVQLIAESMQAEASAVFLLDEFGERLVCRASAGPVNITGLSLARNQGLVGRAIANNRCEIVRDARLDSAFAGTSVEEITGFSTRSVVTAPLVTSEGPIGALQVLNKRGGRLFEDADRDAMRLLASPTALALNRARLTEALMQQSRIQRELTMARRLQRSLLPRRRRGHYPLRALNLPAREISGDFFDFFDLADGRIAFTLGDVAGKGLDAAFLMVRCASLLRWAGKEGLPPSEWLRRANEELREAIAAGMFVCAVAGYYCPASGRAVWANAGFPPLLKMDAAGNVQLFAAEGPPLGIVAGMDFPEQTTTLHDASLYLFSDGVTDVRTESGQMVGVEGIEDAVRELAALSPEARMRALVRRLRGLTLTDDTTLMLIDGGTEHVLLKHAMAAQPESLQPMRHAVADALLASGLDQDLRAALVLAVDEACANVIRHAYGGACSGRIELALSRVGAELRFILRDDAPCVDPQRLRPRDLAECRPGGLGLNFIDAVMDHWQITPQEGGGNVLTMIRRLARESTGAMV